MLKMKLYSKLKDIRAKKSNKKGFTLVELIVVIVIILILAAVLVPSVLRYVDKANQANCKADAATMLSQLQADYAASQASDQTGVTTFPSAIGGITPTAATVEIVATTTIAEKAAQYQLTETEAGTEAAYTEITSFAYSNGTYTAVWTGGKWTVNAND